MTETRKAMPPARFGQPVQWGTRRLKIGALVLAPERSVVVFGGELPGERVPAALWAARSWDPRAQRWIVPAQLPSPGAA